MNRLLTPRDVAARWMRMPEACEYARVSRNTMKRLIREGFVSAGRTPGNHYRIDRESIDHHFGQDEEKALAILRSIRV